MFAAKKKLVQEGQIKKFKTVANSQNIPTIMKCFKKMKNIQTSYKDTTSKEKAFTFITAIGLSRSPYIILRAIPMKEEKAKSDYFPNVFVYAQMKEKQKFPSMFYLTINFQGYY